jgi:hypothetical protein
MEASPGEMKSPTEGKEDWPSPRASQVDLVSLPRAFTERVQELSTLTLRLVSLLPCSKIFAADKA